MGAQVLKLGVLLHTLAGRRVHHIQGLQSVALSTPTIHIAPASLERLGFLLHKNIAQCPIKDLFPRPHKKNVEVIRSAGPFCASE